MSRNRWTKWRSFPDPRKSEMLLAPFGAGCYDIRQVGKSAEKVCFGKGGHVAQRMTSLLPPPLGSGTRNNKGKRDHILANLQFIEYRTLACRTTEDATVEENKLRKLRGYRFPK